MACFPCAQRNKPIQPPTRFAAVSFPPPIAFGPIERLGGKTGWYYGNRLWRTRGFLDLMFGGPGLVEGGAILYDYMPATRLAFGEWNNSNGTICCVWQRKCACLAAPGCNLR